MCPCPRSSAAGKTQIISSEPKLLMSYQTQDKITVSNNKHVTYLINEWMMMMF